MSLLNHSRNAIVSDSMFLMQRELAFFYLITGTSDAQLLQNIRTITASQLSLLRQCAGFILNETIPLFPGEFHSLKKHQVLLRKLAFKTVSSKILQANRKIIKLLAHIAIRHYESCTKGSAGTQGRVGSTEKTKKHKNSRRNLGADKDQQRHKEAGASSFHNKQHKTTHRKETPQQTPSSHLREQQGHQFGRNQQSEQKEAFEPSTSDTDESTTSCSTSSSSSLSGSESSDAERYV